eukprot:CAMPEP_0178389260 /NCGR_PEP_ID=MMETSP0689_2-20121128/10023_1 /TAXON_ID=160604 /ORGANISM="Amphidinium massartii, Strain CS-259" /LENGTH=439 /DNA_ID=CAMNT_0020009701 /DNA_START=77 /DNA_END=1394 /DNA_ORIENTATION=-
MATAIAPQPQLQISYQRVPAASSSLRRSEPMPAPSLAPFTSQYAACDRGAYPAARGAVAAQQQQQQLTVAKPLGLSGIDRLLPTAVASLMQDWEIARGGLVLVGQAVMQGEQLLADGLRRMQQQLAAWQAAHPREPEASLLLYKFPRVVIGKQLEEAVERGILSPLPADVKLRFVHAASALTCGVHGMSITPQEEQMWRKWQIMEVESSEAGELSGQDESFGKHLHLKGGKMGERSIQVMQDWEWPYMYALADLGFRLALTRGAAGTPGPRVLKVLEIGWGQGISGRRLMREPELTGAARYGVRVEYEVIELHPVVAADAERHGAKVHVGPWQKVLPKLPPGSYDLMFYDPFDPAPEHVGEEQKYEKWGLPKVVLESLIFYRVLKPGGVFVQYAISHGKISATQYLRDHVAPLFSDFKLEKISGLVPEANTNYATSTQA